MTAPRTTVADHPVSQEANGPQSILERVRRYREDPVLQRIRPKGMPWACKDEETNMGEATVHTLSVCILLYSLTFHFAQRPGFRVLANLNLYFSRKHPNLCLTPDVMVVETPEPLPENLTSYRIGEQGPAPLLVGEVLSPRTYQEGDLDRKMIDYADIGIDEYLLADVTGDLLPRRLLLLQRRQDGEWREAPDTDGGITSRLGFRVVIEDDGQLRVIDAKTGKRYARPEEAQVATDALALEAAARRQAEERALALEKQLARLRAAERKRKEQEKKGKKGRRRKP
jgi:Uma2 family endonuclease